MEEEKKEITEKQMRKLRNLKYFRDWPEEKIREWYRLRHGDDEVPPASPDEVGIAAGESLPEQPQTTASPEDKVKSSFNAEEYKKKYNSYINRYKKEYAVDMNETNDVEALQALVRYMIQLERANELIMEEQSTASADHRILKGYGDFQRSIQMNVNELQAQLGISRKQRKEKQHDDIPQYITALKEKAKDFWQGKTTAVRCEVCRIELARYWLNFPDMVNSLSFNITCEHCKEKVVHSL